MRVRKMDANGDMTFGRGQANFYKDQAEGPAQVVVTRLYLFLSEWYLDTSDGTTWYTQVLGKYTGDTRDAVLRARILGTPNITSITAYGSQVDRDVRSFEVQATLATAFGPVAMKTYTTTEQNAQAVAAFAIRNIDPDFSTGAFFG